MQKDKDPFRKTPDDERTVFTPQPARRRRGGAAADPLPPESIAPRPVPEPAVRPEAANRRPVASPSPPAERTGGNPLLRAAAELFALVRELRAVRRHDDVPGLRRQVIEAVRCFESDARAAGATPEAALTARYALCGLIDETVLGMPWGLESPWSKESLLITFYKEYSAGERFFALLKKAFEQPKNTIDVLEFLYVCLALGFQGRYRLLPRGGEELARVRQHLYQVIRGERGEPERELSAQWRGIEDRRPVVARVVPPWLLPVMAALVVIAVWGFFAFRLNDASDGVYARLSAIPAVAALPPPVVAPQPPAPAAQPEGLVARLRAGLAEPIRAGLLRVDDLGGSARIVLFNKGLFPSGGAAVGTSWRPIFLAIGGIVQNEPGPFVISGHTDDVPIRTLRFPSNWHLSKARAEAVAAIFGDVIDDPQKLRIEARADADPLVANDTPENRALNRRVEIRIPLRGEQAQQ